jgi:uncharacterized membrane protein
MYALVSLIILGVVAILTLFLTYKKSTFANSFSKITLLISLISFALVAQTGNLGGQIRHTEIRTGSVQNMTGKEKDDD